jgi:hypothetical protein
MTLATNARSSWLRLLPVAFIPFPMVWFRLFVESRVAIVAIMRSFEMLTIASNGAATSRC